MDTQTTKSSFTISLFRAFLLLTILLAPLMGSGKVHAQVCGEDHIVVEGESLSKIAKSVYGDGQKWTIIYTVNLDAIGDNPDLILIDQTLRIPCLEENNEPKLVEQVEKTLPNDDDTNSEDNAAETASATTNTETENSTTESSATEGNSAERSTAISTTTENAVVNDTSSNQSSVTQSTNDDATTITTVDGTDTAGTKADNSDAIKFLTADDYAPFTDRKLVNGGMVTDMLVTALENHPDKPAFDVNWINDWSQHLDPLLTSFEYDLGFPWLQPDCVSTPDDYRCQNFNFSNPVIHMLVLLFTDKERPLIFNKDSDIQGAVLCRPNGYYTHDLEKDGRLWLTNNVIKLEQPSSIKDCFDMLIAGEVDAVALNEYTGRSAVSDLSLSDRVEVLENQPLSIEGLHVVVHKQHPRAQELISIVNEGMTRLQLSSEYNSIVDLHFSIFWSTID